MPIAIAVAPQKCAERRGPMQDSRMKAIAVAISNVVRRLGGHGERATADLVRPDGPEPTVRAIVS
jgi:hypothetical protein